MPYETLLYETRGNVALVTLNRPDRLNAWTGQMSLEQADAFERANNDPAVGAIVMTGAGRGFCAGADIRDAFNARLEGDAKGADTLLPGGMDWVALVERTKPLIAAVNGPAVGVGATMVLPFDVIIASEEAKFGMFFVKMGLVPELASSHYLERRIGFAKASELCLTGELIGAEAALAIGLVNEVTPPHRLLERAMEVGATISGNPDRQLRMIKKLLRENGTETDATVIQEREFAALQEARESPEHKEAVDAFLNKRKPNFRQ
ncbi:MAG: enoyl-CoA hydratase/isomerase family protein [Alphaproteobacteria bacterium]